MNVPFLDLSCFRVRTPDHNPPRGAVRPPPPTQSAREEQRRGVGQLNRFDKRMKSPISPEASNTAQGDPQLGRAVLILLVSVVCRAVLREIDRNPLRVGRSQSRGIVHPCPRLQVIGGRLARGGLHYVSPVFREPGAEKLPPRGDDEQVKVDSPPTLKLHLPHSPQRLGERAFITLLKCPKMPFRRRPVRNDSLPVGRVCQREHRRRSRRISEQGRVVQRAEAGDHHRARLCRPLHNRGLRLKVHGLRSGKRRVSRQPNGCGGDSDVMPNSVSR